MKVVEAVLVLEGVMTPLGFLPSLFAVHISDGVLQSSWLAGGFVLGGFLAGIAAWRIRDEEIPRIALITAAFFVASSIHVKIGPTSWHLLFNGLVGVILGWRAALAIPIGLALQYFLLMHGGFYSLGVNACIMVLPALLASAVFSLMGRARHFSKWRPALAQTAFGFVGGTLAVIATIILNYLALVFGSEIDLTVPARLLVVLYLPVAALEGVIVAFLVGFLLRVKPEMLEPLTPTPLPEAGRGEFAPLTPLPEAGRGEFVEESSHVPEQAALPLGGEPLGTDVSFEGGASGAGARALGSVSSVAGESGQS